MSTIPFDDERLSAGLGERGASLGRGGDGMPRIEVGAGEALEILRWLRDDAALGFDRLFDLTIVDRGDGVDGVGQLDVVYVLDASASGARLRVHARLESEAVELASVVPLWPAADWLEREAFDLFGLRFRGHSGLHRILLPADFEGAPLRRSPFPTPLRPEGESR